MIPKPPYTAERTSELLERLAQDQSQAEISLGQLVDALGDRAFGAVMLLFSLPMIFPMPPGVSAVFGVPLVWFAFQITINNPRPWLPRFIRGKKFSREHLRAVIRKISPFILYFEKFFKPRIHNLTQGWPERLVGLMLLSLALIIFLPIPFGNMLPALAIAVIAIGYIERDGLVILVGIALGFASFVVLYMFFHLVWKALLDLVHFLQTLRGDSDVSGILSNDIDFQ
jgi:hypothetical protein